MKLQDLNASKTFKPTASRLRSLGTLGVICDYPYRLLQASVDLPRSEPFCYRLGEWIAKPMTEYPGRKRGWRFSATYDNVSKGDCFWAITFGYVVVRIEESSPNGQF